MNDTDSTLYKIVLEELHSGAYDEASEKDFIAATRARYLKEAPRGSLPHVLNDEFTTGLDVEIRDTLKAVTYGHFGIKSYNERRKNKKPDKI